MKKSILSIVMLLSLIFLFLFAACSSKGGNEASKEPSSGMEKEVSQEAPETPSPEEEKEEEEPLPDVLGGALECDWTLCVDQTIPVEEDGMVINYSLVLIAQKLGGTDVYGTYEGAAYIGANLDASTLSNEVVKVTGGFDMKAFADDISFEVVPYDINSYSDYGVKKGEIGVAPLVKYESMALLSPEMSGGGIVNPMAVSIDGLQMGYSDEAYDTQPIPMKIAINSGKVYVDVVPFNIGRHFEGTLTGEPVGSVSGLFVEKKDKIEELKEDDESEEEEPSADSPGGFGGLGDIMGQFGTNLPMPESFPLEDFPLVSDAVIINVYEKKETNTVRVMYGTSMPYEDVLEFYREPVVEKMDVEPIDTDAGVMYIGQSEGYRNITLFIMEDKSNTYATIVSIDVSKR